MGVSARQKAAPKVLESKLRAEPKKRKKRGILKKTVLKGKKRDIIKSVKPRKHVQFGKKKTLHKRRAQEVKEIVHEASYGAKRAVVGTKGDIQERIFRLNEAGQLVASARPARKIRLV